MEEAKKMKCYKRLIFKQFVQVSGLCGPQFLSYLPKRFTHLCRALYGDAMLVHRFGAPLWPPENNENININASYFDPRITSVNVGEFYRILVFRFSFWALFRYAANEFYLKVCFSDYSRFSL